MFILVSRGFYTVGNKSRLCQSLQFHQTLDASDKARTLPIAFSLGCFLINHQHWHLHNLVWSYFAWSSSSLSVQNQDGQPPPCPSQRCHEKKDCHSLCFYFSSNSCDFTLPEVWVLWNWKIKCSPDSEPDWFPRLYTWDKEAAAREVNIWSVPSNHTNGFQVLGAQSIVAQQQQRKMQHILFSDNCSAATF